MLQLLRSAPLVVRYTICQQVVSILHLTPTHINEMATFPGWVNLFLWLLTPFDHCGSGKGEKDLTEGEKSVEEKNKSCTYDRAVAGGGEEAISEVKEKMKGEGLHSTVPVVNLDLVESGVCNGVNVEENEGSQRERPAVLTSGQPCPAQYRAFLHSASSHGGQRNSSLSATRGQGVGVGGLKMLVIHNSSWTQCDPEDKKEDVWRTFSIVTETIGYILWHSVDYEKQQLPWKVWGMFLSSLDEFSSQHTLILPAFTVKQRLVMIAQLCCGV